MRAHVLMLATLCFIAASGCSHIRHVQTVPNEASWDRYHQTVDEIEPGLEEAELVTMFDDAVPGQSNIGWIKPEHLPKELRWDGMHRRMYILGYYEPQLRGGYRDMPVTTIVVDNGVVSQVAVIE